jgi:hypothetical protein
LAKPKSWEDGFATPAAIMKFRKQLWTNECGFVNAAAYMFVVTILLIGMVAGLTSFRDQLVQELGDLAVGLENIDQSYSFEINGTISEYEDPDGPEDVACDPPGGISLMQPPTAESNVDAPSGHAESSN